MDRGLGVTLANVATSGYIHDMETGIRGLTLTKEPAFLQPYTSAKRALPSRLAAMQSLVADEPAQRRRAQQLEAAIRDYVDNFTVPLVAIVKETPAIGRDPLVAEQGKQYTDGIQNQFNRFLIAEIIAFGRCQIFVQLINQRNAGRNISADDFFI